MGAAPSSAAGSSVSSGERPIPVRERPGSSDGEVVEHTQTSFAKRFENPGAYFARLECFSRPELCAMFSHFQLIRGERGLSKDSLSSLFQCTLPSSIKKAIFSSFLSAFFAHYGEEVENGMLGDNEISLTFADFALILALTIHGNLFHRSRFVFDLYFYSRDESKSNQQQKNQEEEEEKKENTGIGIAQLMGRELRGVLAGFSSDDTKGRNVKRDCCISRKDVLRFAKRSPFLVLTDASNDPSSSWNPNSRSINMEQMRGAINTFFSGAENLNLSEFYARMEELSALVTTSLYQTNGYFDLVKGKNEEEEKKVNSSDGSGSGSSSGSRSTGRPVGRFLGTSVFESDVISYVIAWVVIGGACGLCSHLRSVVEEPFERAKNTFLNLGESSHSVEKKRRKEKVFEEVLSVNGVERRVVIWRGFLYLLDSGTGSRIEVLPISNCFPYLSPPDAKKNLENPRDWKVFCVSPDQKLEFKVPTSYVSTYHPAQLLSTPTESQKRGMLSPVQIRRKEIQERSFPVVTLSSKFLSSPGADTRKQKYYPPLTSAVREILFRKIQNTVSDFTRDEEEMLGPIFHMIRVQFHDKNVGVALKDRKFLFRTYPNCFVGREAVDWISERLGCSREEATEIGKYLFSLGDFEHCTRAHHFKDGYFFYRFIEGSLAPEAPNKAAVSPPKREPKPRLKQETSLFFSVRTDITKSADGVYDIQEEREEVERESQRRRDAGPLFHSSDYPPNDNQLMMVHSLDVEPMSEKRDGDPLGGVGLVNLSDDERGEKKDDEEEEEGDGDGERKERLKVGSGVTHKLSETIDQFQFSPRVPPANPFVSVLLATKKNKRAENDDPSSTEGNSEIEGGEEEREKGDEREKREEGEKRDEGEEEGEGRDSLMEFVGRGGEHRNKGVDHLTVSLAPLFEKEGNGEENEEESGVEVVEVDEEEERESTGEREGEMSLLNSSLPSEKLRQMRLSSQKNMNKNINLSISTEDLEISEVEHDRKEAENCIRSLRKKVACPHSLQTLTDILVMNQQAEFAANGGALPFSQNIDVQFYVDGCEYYPAVAAALNEATNEIFIGGWCLSPQVYLRRDSVSTREMQTPDRLDTLLSLAASRGVKIFILIWNETKLPLEEMIGSALTVKHLLSLHPKNIHVIRHPKSFPLYWTHHQKMVVVDQQIAFIGGLDLCFGRYDTPDHRVTDDSHFHTLFPGKDFYNPRLKPPSDLAHPFSDLLDRQRHPRMPWHDVSLRLNRQAAADVAWTFIQRWNECRKEPMDPGKASLPSLLPKFRYYEKGTEPRHQRPGSCNVQILRSLSQWSAGIAVERSVYNGIVGAIENAKHYIYIENQYFISNPSSEEETDPLVENRVANAILRRIVRAIEVKETFRVFLILPLHPEGDPNEQTIRLILHYQYRSLCRGSAALIPLIEKACASSGIPGLKASDYIKVFSLKNYGVLASGKVLVEQVYVHSKMMIVDDSLAIVGSANINDRSLLGNRDSEIAALVKDEEMVPAVMDGAFYLAGRSISSPFFLSLKERIRALRLRLWAEHLGLLNETETFVDILDPVSQVAWSLFSTTAEHNRQCYDAVEHTLENTVAMTFDSYGKQEGKWTPESGADTLRDVQGHLVPFPQDFLMHSSLEHTYLTAIAECFV